MKKYELLASPHTIQIKSSGIVDTNNKITGCMTTSFRKQDEQIISSTKINLHKIGGNIYTYTEYVQLLDEIIKELQIKDYYISRIDMRLDSFDADHYLKYAKLYRYIISSLAETYSVTNTYQTFDLFNQELKSIAIKNNRFEVEAYDKEQQTNGTDAAKSRLELRSLALHTTNINQTFVKDWFRRLDKASKNLEQVKQRYNDELEKIYKENKDCYPIKFSSLKDFLVQYQYCIFDRKQLINLLSRFNDEVKNPEARADNHKQRCGIEYISESNFRKAIEEILRSITNFFES